METTRQLNELNFPFEGKIYKANVRFKKYHSHDSYYIALLSEELISRFTISYLFNYSDTRGLNYVSTVQDPKNKPLIETLQKALLPFIR
jgi:hypothetical protein